MTAFLAACKSFIFRMSSELSIIEMSLKNHTKVAQKYFVKLKQFLKSFNFFLHLPEKVLHLRGFLLKRGGGGLKSPSFCMLTV